MDKYQCFVLKNAGYGVWKDESLKDGSRMDKQDDNSSWTFILDTDNKIIINQDENYNITQYYVVFQPTVVKVIAGGKEYNLQNIVKSLQRIVKLPQQYVIVPVDFNYKIPEMELHFNGVIDPIKILIEYKAVDKKIFDAKLEKERQSNLAAKAYIKESTGADLVNIYFQPCCDSYGKTVVELYLADGKFSSAPLVMGRSQTFHPKLISATPAQMIGKFKVDDGMMFKSITGLAKGAYAFKLSQYDDKDDLLFTTDYQYFQIG